MALHLRPAQIGAMPGDRKNSVRVDLIRSHDPCTLDAVARENIDMLLRGARLAGIVGDDAYDVVQETFLVFVRKASEFDGRASIRTWLYGIMLKKISERRRTQWREEPRHELDAVFEQRFDLAGRWIRPPALPDAYTAANQAMEWLNDCIGSLPERRRIAFQLREVEQMEVGEICNILDMSPNNLRVLLFRARSALRECMESKGIHGRGDVEL